MAAHYHFYAYILTNESRTLYIGVTRDLERRMQEHKSGEGSAFTCKYSLHKLVYCETYNDIREAVKREKQLKGWSRAKKIALIKAQNPAWVDLAVDRNYYHNE